MIIGMAAESRKRSRGYPSVSVEDAAQFISRAYRGFGTTEVDREGLVHELGHSSVSGAAASKVAALVHYGLLDKLGGTYKVSELGSRIARPVPGEEKELLREAFQHCDLFSEILDRFSGAEQLPEGLPVLLERNFGILHPHGDQVARIFKESAQQVGIIDGNGRLIRATQNAEALGDQERKAEDEAADERSPSRSESKTLVDYMRTHVPADFWSIDLDGKVILQVSRALGEQDVARIKAWLQKVVIPHLEFQLGGELD